MRSRGGGGGFAGDHYSLCSIKTFLLGCYQFTEFSSKSYILMEMSQQMASIIATDVINMLFLKENKVYASAIEPNTARCGQTIKSNCIATV